MAKYRIGNAVRGEFYFDAPDDETAWTIGAALFDNAYPTVSGHGRMVMLEAVRPVKQDFTPGKKDTGRKG